MFLANEKPGDTPDKKQELKQAILKTHSEVLKRSPQGVEQYACWMSERGIETNIKRSPTGRLLGVQFIVEGKKVAASKVHPSLAVHRITTTLSLIH